MGISLFHHGKRIKGNRCGTVFLVKKDLETAVHKTGYAEYRLQLLLLVVGAVISGYPTVNMLA
jgi:hypothetical protein